MAKVAVELFDPAKDALPVEDLVNVYRGTYVDQPPYYDTEDGVRGFRKSAPGIVDLPGLRMAIARADEQIVGFCFGYEASKPVWHYPDGVRAALPPDEADRWFRDSFWFAELDLVASYRGLGVGGRLHDAVMRDLPYATSVTMTLQEPTDALALYKKRGWVEIMRDYYHPGMRWKYVIIGLDLKS